MQGLAGRGRVAGHQGEDGDSEERRDDVQAINVFEGRPVVADDRVPFHRFEQQDVNAEEDSGQQMVDHQGERDIQHLALETKVNIRPQAWAEAVTQHQRKEDRHCEQVADH